MLNSGLLYLTSSGACIDSLHGKAPLSETLECVVSVSLHW